LEERQWSRVFWEEGKQYKTVRDYDGLPENKRVIYGIRRRKENNNKQNYRGG